MNFSPEMRMDHWAWRLKFSESFSLDRYWSIECSSLKSRKGGKNGKESPAGIAKKGPKIEKTWENSLANPFFLPFFVPVQLGSVE